MFLLGALLFDSPVSYAVSNCLLLLSAEQMNDLIWFDLRSPGRRTC